MTTRTPSRPSMDARIRQRRIAVYELQVRRRHRWIVSGAAVVVLAVATITTARSPLFALTQVDLAGVSGERAAELRGAMPVRLGENLLDIDLGQVERQLAAVPWVRTVDASRKPPSTLHVQVAVRQPAAVVQLADRVWTVDAEGVVIAAGAQRGLVVIEAPRSVLPGPGTRASDAAVRNALAVHASLPPLRRHAVDRYDAPSERGLRLHLVLGEDGMEGVWVKFGSVDRSEQKARVLEALLEEVRKAAVPVAEIDVRAPDNPVLVPA